MIIKKIILILLSFSVTYLTANPGQVIRRLPSPGKFGSGLAFDGHYLWLSDYNTEKLYCIDPEKGTLQREIPSPGFWPMDLTWDGNSLWNIDKKQKKIFRIDPSDGAILGALDSPSDNPEGLAWDGQMLWISDSKSNKIMKLDLSDGTALATFDAPGKSAVGLTFDGKYLWCTDRIYDEIYMIEPSNGECILIIKAPGKYSRGLAFDEKHLWCADYQSDSLYQIVRQDDQWYSLENTRSTEITFSHEVTPQGKGSLRELQVNIAVPENMPQQKIISVDYIPASYKINKDRWQQPIAVFSYQNISAPQLVRTKMVVRAEISDIHYYIFPEKCGTLADIPSEIRKRYTADGSKYQLNDPFIRTQAAKIVGDEKNPYWIARKIFDYVRNTLEYSLEGGWNVAPFVLNRGTGSCSEYTFSFIALARSAGLPARFVGAIVVRGDDASMDDVFHRWPEIYLPQYGWIPIDPQGGDKPLPRDRAMNIGHLPNRFLITTQGGGDSEYLGWYYNSFEWYKADPQLQINIETFGEWEPIKNAVH